MLDIVPVTELSITKKQKQRIADNIPRLEYVDDLFKYLHSYYKLVNVCQSTEKFINGSPRKTLYIYLKSLEHSTLKVIKCRYLTFVPYYDPWTERYLFTEKEHERIRRNIYCIKSVRRKKDKQKTEKKICYVCGKEFYVFPNSNRKTCGSSLCKKEYKRLKIAESRAINNYKKESNNENM